MLFKQDILTWNLIQPIQLQHSNELPQEVKAAWVKQQLSQLTASTTYLKWKNMWILQYWDATLPVKEFPL